MMKLLNPIRSIITIVGRLMANCQFIIRTLQMIGIGSLLLAGVFFVSTVQGSRNDEIVEKYLNSPGIIEKFNEADRKSSELAKDQTSLLVKQAEAFAIHLGAKSKSRKPMPVKNVRIEPIQMLSSDPNFKVLGTSFFRSNPEISLVLIEEPGKERRWFRQSNRVGKFLIKQIKDGCVIVQNGQDIFELILEQRLERDLNKEMFSVTVKAEGKREAKPISVRTKYNDLEPMWGQDESNPGLLSYANSPK